MASPAIAADPLWFAHRYDPGHDAVQFRRLTRDDHRRATFLTDEYLGPAAPVAVARRDARAAMAPSGPVHFIFHSAFCCSTLLARAFDAPGVSMGLKEPPLLNDLVGWQHRGGAARDIAAVLDDGLALLARPLAPGEATVIKPSNVCNGLAPAMMAMRAEARALLLHAPLPVFLGSIVRKGIDGRMWVRDLLVKQLKERLHPFGFGVEDYLGQTDLQVAAMGWLAQHALFAHMVRQFGPRVAVLDSESLLARPHDSVAALARLFGVALDVPAVVAGPAFTRNAKDRNQAFDAAARAAARASEAAHADEIAKVVTWTRAVADSARVPIDLPGRLLA